MKRLICALLFVVASRAATVQAATVFFEIDTSQGATLVEATTWVPTLYVNGTPFTLTPTCTQTGSAIACTAPLPNVTGALLPTGKQTFELDLRDPVLGSTSPKSVPFIRSRPVAPINGRLQ